MAPGMPLLLFISRRVTSAKHDRQFLRPQISTAENRQSTLTPTNRADSTMRAFDSRPMLQWTILLLLPANCFTPPVHYIVSQNPRVTEEYAGA